jgi:hypothetical protein
VCLHYPGQDIAYHNLHVLAKRATPAMCAVYKLALLLYKVMNDCMPDIKWTHLNFDHVLTSRQTHFCTRKTNSLKVGLNAISNFLFYLNDLMLQDWFKMSIKRYKKNCKIKFLTL